MHRDREGLERAQAIARGVTSMDAPFLYLVRFWVDPKGLDQVMHWLESRHMAEVIAQDGFLWVQRLRLDQPSDDGWSAHMMIYGLASRTALQAYFDGPAPARFAAERKPFEQYLRMDRAWGAVDFRLP
jgi:hypothetical protein